MTIYSTDGALSEALNSGSDYISPNSKTYASDTWAQLIRSEYEDYEDRFQPYEQKLLSLADSEALLDEELSRISASSAQRFSMAKQNSALMNQKYGVQTTARQDNYNQTQMDAQRGLAIAQSKNNTRLADADRRVGILTGSSTTRQSATNYEG